MAHRITFKQMLTNARIAMWRRYQYRSLLDVPKDFFFRSTTQSGSLRPKRSTEWAISLRPKSVADPLYLRPFNSDFLVFGEIFDDDEYAPVKQWNLPPDAVVFDLGANIGLAGLYFDSLCPRATIIAVEPDENNCRLIQRNCGRLIRENRLHVVNAFVAAADGHAVIDRSRSSWAFTKMDGADAPGQTVPCLSMASLIGQFDVKRIDLLKCDIEGSEQELFANCRDWIDRVKRLVVETHRPYYTSDLYAALRAAGWEFEIIAEEQEDYSGMAFLERRAPAQTET